MTPAQGSPRPQGQALGRGTGGLGGAVLHELLSAGYRVRATARGEESRDRVLARVGDAAG